MVIQVILNKHTMKTFKAFNEAQDWRGSVHPSITADSLARRGILHSVPKDKAVLKADIRDAISRLHDKIRDMENRGNKANSQDVYDWTREEILYHKQSIDFCNKVLADLK